MKKRTMMGRCRMKRRKKMNSWGDVLKSALASILVAATFPVGFFVVVIWAIFSKE
jgi:hypothetical protein